MANGYKSKITTEGTNIEEPLLLWTNPNDYLNATTIQLTFDTTKYKYLIVSFIRATDNTVQGSNIERLGVIIDINKNFSSAYDFQYFYGKEAFLRTIFIENVTSTGLNFRITKNGSYHEYAVPKHIWALTENTKMPVIS